VSRYTSAPGALVPYLTGEESDDRFSAARALHWYCVDFHSGQWSDLYRIQCRLGYRPGALENGPESGTLDAEIYTLLESGDVDAAELADWIRATGDNGGMSETAHYRCES